MVSGLKSEHELFSSVDAAWLHMDTPTNLAVITGVITLNERVDFERLKEIMRARLLIHSRFQQRVKEAEIPLGLPQWETDPAFELENHLQRLQLPAPAGHKELQDLVGELISQPMLPSRPLWIFYLVENYEDRAVLIVRLHHCIADGLALIELMLKTADLEPDAPLIPAPAVHYDQAGLLDRLLAPAYKAAHMMETTIHTTETLVHEGMQALVHPARLLHAARLGTDYTRALGKLLFIGPDRRTVLRGKCGISKRAAWKSDIDLEKVKAVGRLMGGTVNDVLLSALTGGLRRYLEERKDSTLGLNIRAIVPVNLRPLGDNELVGNRFGLVFLSLPIGVQDPLKRLVVLRRRMERIKNSSEAIVAIHILGAIGMSPSQIERIIIAIFGMKGTAVMTNVPGPRQPLYLAGAKIDNLVFWVPTPANLGLGVSIISYAGRVTLGIAADENLIPDPEAIIENFSQELDYLSRWGKPTGHVKG